MSFVGVHFAQARMLLCVRVVLVEQISLSQKGLLLVSSIITTIDDQGRIHGNFFVTVAFAGVEITRSAPSTLVFC